MQDGRISLLKEFFRKKWVWAIGAIDVVVVIGIVIVSIVEATKTAVMSFNIVPMDATISVNGSTGYKASGEAYRFAPGTYEVVISHPELETKTFNFELESGRNTTVVAFLADADFEYYQLKENYGAFVSLADIASKSNNQTMDHDDSAEEFIEKFQKDYNFIENDLPIIDKTPSKYGIQYGTHFQYDYLKIQNGDGKTDCTKTLCLYITDTSGEKEEFALSVIRKFGFDPEDFQIVYKKVGYEE